MPLYEYECENCHTHFEKIQSVHAEPIRECPNCSSDNVRKVIHAAGIIFKGSGWYITDSRQSASGTVGSNASSSNSNPTGSPGSSDSTPSTPSPTPSPTSEPKSSSSEPKKESKS
jgi:putative FmdB family regulatory protein